MIRSESLAYQCDFDEGSGIIDAAQSGNLEMFSQLLTAKNPLDFRKGEGMRVLTWACEHGRLDIMKLLVGHGAPIDMVY